MVKVISFHRFFFFKYIYFILSFSGHHAGIANKALTEFVEFDKAIDEALKRVDLDETLAVVTADHSHV